MSEAMTDETEHLKRIELRLVRPDKRDQIVEQISKQFSAELSEIIKPIVSTCPTPAPDSELGDELANLAKRANDRPWSVGAIPCDGDYGNGPNTRTGFQVSAMLNESGEIIFDALNSENGEVAEQGDTAWDWRSEADFELIAALVNNLPEILSALRTPSYAQGLGDGLLKPLRDWQSWARETFPGSPHQIPDYEAFVKIVEAIEKTASAIRALPKDSDQSDALREALEQSRKAIVIAISFLQRDKGTQRLDHNIDRVIEELVTGDEWCRQALAQINPQSTDDPSVIKEEGAENIFKGGILAKNPSRQSRSGEP